MHTSPFIRSAVFFSIMASHFTNFSWNHDEWRLKMFEFLKYEIYSDFHFLILLPIWYPWYGFYSEKLQVLNYLFLRCTYRLPIFLPSCLQNTLVHADLINYFISSSSGSSCCVLYFPHIFHSIPKYIVCTGIPSRICSTQVVFRDL